MNSENKMKRIFLASLTLVLGCLMTGASNAATRPNVLVILADDLGFSDLGCYGGDIETPNLDALASNGLRFTQFYNTARCWPSRAALLTGYYAQQVRRDVLPGAFAGGKGAGGKGARPVWAPLVSTLLSENGYQCYHSGKWHVDGEPLKNGFSRSFEAAAKGESNYFKASGTTEEGRQVEQTPDYYITTAVAGHALKCLEDHAEKFSDKPFFQYIAFTAPHFPLQAPEADIAKYRDRYLKGWNAVSSERHARLAKLGITRNPLPEMEREVGPPYRFPEVLDKLGGNEVMFPVPWGELSEGQRAFQATKMAIHAAMVDRMDQEIGRILAQLKAMGALENTLIMFASDNGASAEMMIRGDGHDPSAAPGSASTFLCLGPGWSSASNTPFRRHKTWVHEGGISTPFIVHWPAGVPARGELRHHPGHLVDVVPTLLELTGVQKSAERGGVAVPAAPGHSFADVLRRDDPAMRGSLWWMHDRHRALRQGDWKLVALADGPWELYNLGKDRGESQNLASAQPERVKELEGLWTRQFEETVRLVKSIPADSK